VARKTNYSFEKRQKELAKKKKKEEKRLRKMGKNIDEENGDGTVAGNDSSPESAPE